MKIRLLIFLSALPFVLLGMAGRLCERSSRTRARLHGESSSSCGTGFEPTT